MSENDSETALWYVVVTKARGEAVAKANLERQGYSAFSPIISQKKAPPVPSSSIAALQGTSGAAVGAPLPFNQADKVRLIAGPFAGIEAVFDMPRGEDRAQVPLELLGKVQRLTVNQDDLSQ